MPEVVEHVTSQLCREKFWSRKKRAIKVTIATAIILVILCLIVVVVVRQLDKEKPNDIIKQYENMFVKVDDMASTDDILLNLPTVDVPEKSFDIKETCTLSCSAASGNDTEDEPKLGRQKENVNIRNHGCCASYLKYFSPDTLPNGQGQLRRLVQFKSRKQRLLQDDCSHIKGCTRGCTCKQQKIRTQALVIDYDGKDMKPPPEDDKITFAMARLELVEYPGFCKCYN